MTNTKNIGHVLWTDLTIDNAEEVKDFYAAVIGWDFDAANMGEYDDYVAKSTAPPLKKSDAEKSMIAGICHARGDNADMPAQWIMYMGVADLDHAMTQTEKLGGKIKSSIKSYGEDRFVAIQDPAGAVIGLYEQAIDS